MASTSNAKRVVIYTRPDNAVQLAKVRLYASAKGYDVVAEASDDGPANMPAWDRPGFSFAASLVSSDEADTIVALSLDRVTRMPNVDMPEIGKRNIRIELVQ